ncbi:MAG: hypothetical protein MRY86_08005 [Phaeodactylibacter sp.]|nr:hypothetical protein [Phaeodactylibacter sp.]
MRKQKSMIPGHVPRVLTYSGSPYRTLEEFFLKHRPPEQAFLINAARNSTIVGEKGTRLTFPAHSLSTTTGQRIDGQIQVRLTEISTPVEHLLAARPTASEDRVVDAISQVQFNIFKDGAPLQLNEPVMMEIPVSPHNAHPPGNAKLFARSLPTVRSVKSNTFLDWRLVKTPVEVRKVGDRRYLGFPVQRCSWYQCGHFFARKDAKVMVTAKIIANADSFESQEAFLWLDNSSVITKLYPSDRHFSGLNIPRRASGHVIAYGMSKGQLHFGAARLKKAADKLLNVYMRPMAEAEIIEAIQHL